jgi:hypothetical protein
LKIELGTKIEQRAIDPTRRDRLFDLPRLVLIELREVLELLDWRSPTVEPAPEAKIFPDNTKVLVVKDDRARLANGCPERPMVVAGCMVAPSTQELASSHIRPKDQELH